MIGDSNDSSGTVGFLVGMVVLVFAGIVFSLMVDKRFRFSSGRADLEQEVQDQRQAVKKLGILVETAREEWKRKVQPFEGQAGELRSFAEANRGQSRKLAELRGRQAALEEEIVAAENAFREYRTKFRSQARLAAAGEELGELEIRSGRTYHAVTISRVTPEGMEIRHSDGIALLRPEDLDDSWQERFDWHPEELEKPQPVPAEPKPAAPAADAPVADPVDTETLAAQAEARKLAALRRDVSEARRFLDKAEAELSRAREGARNSRGASVPGSLETWTEKIQRLESMTSKFRAQYVTARGKLAASAPDDPLLRQPADR